MDSKRKIVDRGEMPDELLRLRETGKTVVFTNGCFDILHTGHVDYIEFARSQGDVLIIGINSDASVRRNKGGNRPIVPQENRARVLAALESVDYVVVFDEDEPAQLVEELLPDVLVKGADWSHYVSGREAVEKNGGKVILADLTEGQSTTGIIETIEANCRADNPKG
ncbi:MAG: D-glycero-beta-D-manno-heptose 1-phosphate adenylyltransferase [Kiritimatiellia bacterium]|jgi:rfaE bifunctional protein nucleotidyltransferase chain/domain|nr:D-glycero-beta-D-manno-heptose 1-phosphate adenylyltransferase [Kiritimatiellia bacterium]